MANPKHVFDFEGILNIDVNQDNWKEFQKKLEGALGNVKMAIDQGMAKEEAEKIVGLFNEVLAKAKLPDIGIEDLNKNFEQVSYNIEKAIGLINNIDTSVLKGIETSVDRIADTVDRIADKVGAIKPKSGALDGFKKEIENAEDNLDDLIKKKKELEQPSKYKNQKAAASANNVTAGTELVVDKQDIEQKLSNVLSDFKQALSAALKKNIHDSNAEELLNNITQEYVAKILDGFDFGDTKQKFVEQWLKKMELGDVGVKAVKNKLMDKIVAVRKSPSPGAPQVVADNQSVEVAERAAKAAQDMADAEKRAAAYAEKRREAEEAAAKARESAVGSTGGVPHSSDKTYVGIDKDSLKAVLSDITYNVKIQNDDSDKSANKIALDDSSLKSTLNEVFGKILNAPEGGGSDTQESLAKESTLGDIKTVLGNIHTTINQLDWTTVVVQAIEAQGGQIAETIKLLLPERLTDGPDKIDDTKLIDAFNVLTDAIKNWKTQIANDMRAQGFSENRIKNATKPRYYFDDILNQSKPIDVNVVNAMDALGMMSGGKPSFKLASIGGLNTGVAIGDELVYHTTPANQTGDLYELMKKQNAAYNAGASVSRIIAAEIQDNIAYQLQTKAYGTNVRSGDGGGFINATDKQIDQLLYTLEVLEKEGLVAEFRGDNLLYDKDKGFSIIDLSSEEILNHNRDNTTADDMLREIAFHGADNRRMSDTDLRQFRNRLYTRQSMPADQRLVNADTIAAEKAARQQMQQRNAQVGAQITPTIEDGAVAKAVADDAAKFPPTVDVTPTIDKGAVQAALDNIGKLNLDVNFNTQGITTAVKEALYAKEIRRDFNPLDFNDVFEKDYSSKRFENILTGGFADSLDEAKAEFESNFKGKWYDTNTGSVLSTDEMLDKIVRLADLTERSAPKLNDFAQIIVDAINTQSGNIIETIKLILPQNVTGGDVDESKLIQAFEKLTSFIAEWSRNTGNRPSAFFKRIANGANVTSDAGVKDALRVLGLISSDGTPTLKVPDAGKLNLGTAIGDTKVVSTQSANNMRDAPEVVARITKAVELGAAVPKMFAIHEEKVMRGVDAIFNLQERAIGKNITDYDTDSLKTDTGFLDATTEQIDRLLHTFEVLEKVGLRVDLIGDNILFDEKAGFSMIDFEIGQSSAQDIFDGFINKLQYSSSGGNRKQVNQFIQTAQSRWALPSSQRSVNDATIAEDRRRQEAARQQQAQQQKDDVVVGAKITPTMDEGAIAQLVQENVDKTPAVVKVTPVIDSAAESQQAIQGESQEAIDAAKAFVDAAKAKKEFVKSNKMVAESAEESEVAVEQESQAVAHNAHVLANANGLAKEKQILDANDNLLRREEVRKTKTNNAVVTKTDTFIPDDDGNEQLAMQTIIQDFEKFAKEAKKTEDTVARAQKKLNEFLARFKSKTGGKANLVTGFNDLDGQTVTADNMEETFNKMTQLQAEYAKLEASFRKGQSSLNPFVNAINKSENIENIFSGVEAKFNNLISRSDELTKNFERLRELSEAIASFSDRMSRGEVTDPAEFSDFAKQVGEFNALKTQVEGGIKNEGRNKPNRNKFLKDLEALYVEAEQNRAKYELSGSQQELEHIKNISLKISKKKEEIDLTAQEIAMLKERSKAAYEAQKREGLGAQTDADRKKALKQEIKNSRDKFRVNRASSVFNSGRNVQDSLGILPEDIDVSGFESVQKLNLALENMGRLREVINQQGHIVTKAEGDQLKAYTLDIQKYSAQVKELVKNYEMLSDENSTSLNATFAGGINVKDQLVAAVQEFEHGKATIKSYDEVTKTLTYTVKTGAHEFTTYTAGIRDADDQIRRLAGTTQRTESFMESFKRKFGEIFKYFSASSMIFKVFNEVKKGVQYVKEIDAALVELRKVTDETEETYDKFLKTASKTADKLGSTISAVTEATATFAKLGYTMEMAAEMAEAAIVYKNVGDNIASTEDAANSIISTLKGFGLEASEAMRIVDRFNEVGNKFAITSQGIGEALRLSASALSEGGNTLDESIGIITAAM